MNRPHSGDANAAATLSNIRAKEYDKEKVQIAETLLQLCHPKMHKKPEFRAPNIDELEKAKGLGIPGFENFTVEVRYRRRHNSRRTFDLYYIAPSGKKYRSFLAIQRDLIGRHTFEEDTDSDGYHTSDDDSDTETEQLRTAAPIVDYMITLVIVTSTTKQPIEISVYPSLTVAEVLRKCKQPSSALFIYGGYVRENDARLQDFVRNTRPGRRFVAGIFVRVSKSTADCRVSAKFKTWTFTNI